MQVSNEYRNNLNPELDYCWDNDDLQTIETMNVSVHFEMADNWGAWVSDDEGGHKELPVSLGCESEWTKRTCCSDSSASLSSNNDSCNLSLTDLTLDGESTTSLHVTTQGQANDDLDIMTSEREARTLFQERRRVKSERAVRRPTSQTVNEVHAVSHNNQGHKVRLDLTAPAFTPDDRRRKYQVGEKKMSNRSRRQRATEGRNSPSCRKETKQTTTMRTPQDKTDLFFNRMQTCEKPKFYKGSKRGHLPRRPSVITENWRSLLNKSTSHDDTQDEAQKVAQLNIPMRGESARVLYIEF